MLCAVGADGPAHGGSVSSQMLPGTDTDEDDLQTYQAGNAGPVQAEGARVCSSGL